MKKNKASVIVIGNEKGGVGKTTCAIHSLIYLLYKGHKVASIDLDSHQKSLTTYINNRVNYIKENKNLKLPIPKHFLVTASQNINREIKFLQERKAFQEVITSSLEKFDYVIIDTPGYNSYLSGYAHSYADIIITPVNDSFIDIDVIAKYDSKEGGSKFAKSYKPSPYSQLIWEHKMQKLKRDNKQINWLITRNRLSNLNSKNKTQVCEILEILAKKIGFKIIPGFKERVIFKELFLKGLTLLDTKANLLKKPTISNIAAREELKQFMNSIIVT
ncbi:MAG: AAA family ATPase [Rickettsia sp.]|nr:AAA family ATPase [Rickettsia sp.]